ncbi:alpha/beta hydrolase [Skermanella mucosa]|uniref:esterase/lipase family protein n=1 Tax=Skermanella mucosa TaxID=1789672 RepID=UPI00192BA213|nr:alpha/beta hydrolase [Skermanella mucosa]UEM19761.1 alpha/beta hydrolase [Skermanella mucosa]
MMWPTCTNRCASLILLAGVLFAGGCATPISVEHLDHATVHQQLTRNVLSAHTLSDPTRNVLRQRYLTDRFRERPEYAIAELHAAVAEGRGEANDIFALAEMSFLHAEERGGRPYYLASALYAYAFLFPGNAGQPPDPYDPRLRLASDLYNRGLTSGLIADDGERIAIQSASYPLPFGRLDVDFDPRDLEWGGRELTSFFPVAELEIRGLDNRYRQSGIGAPLAAGTTQANVTKGFQVGQRVKVPVTALLRVDDPRRQLARGSVRAQLELHASSDTQAVLIDRRQVPLEIEYTSTLAYMLSGSAVWDWELAGFLRGSLLAENPTRLGALEPYKPGRFPVVFVHGTASSPARWAEMLNDLRSDPRIRDHFQFWFFGYETGNPVPYSALLLRESLQEAISALDPSESDPALREMVVIGHSQGGLLTKLTAVESGDRFWNAAFRKPPDELRMSPESRDLLKRALFVKPVPSVKRLVFIATPHGGSYVAGNRISHYIASLVRLPGNILRATSEVLAQSDGETTTLTAQTGFGSVYGMTPGSVLVQTLARTPITEGVKAHSIIAVRGDGPVEVGDDGVVEYRSAHIEGVESEYIVRSGHSTQADPHTIEEVRRILLLHLAESCTKRGNCGQAPDRPALVANELP